MNQADQFSVSVNSLLLQVTPEKKQELSTLTDEVVFSEDNTDEGINVTVQLGFFGKCSCGSPSPLG